MVVWGSERTAFAAKGGSGRVSECSSPQRQLQSRSDYWSRSMLSQSPEWGENRDVNHVSRPTKLQMHNVTAMSSYVQNSLCVCINGSGFNCDQYWSKKSRTGLESAINPGKNVVIAATVSYRVDQRFLLRI